MRDILLLLFVIELPEEEVRASREECVWGPGIGDAGDVGAVLGVEAAQHVQHLTAIRHRLADVAKSVGKELEFGVVLGDREIALVEGAILGLEIDRAVELVVVEETVDGGPDGVGGGVGGAHDVEDVRGDGVVEPADEALINHGPIWIKAIGC